MHSALFLLIKQCFTEDTEIGKAAIFQQKNLRARSEVKCSSLLNDFFLMIENIILR